MARDANKRTIDFLFGGPHESWSDPRLQATLSSMFWACGEHIRRTDDGKDFLFMEQNACPTCGSCAGMFTANSMRNCLLEMLGLLQKWNCSSRF